MILHAIGTPIDCLSRGVPEPDAAPIFTAVGAEVPLALKPGRVARGSTHMSDMPAFQHAELRGQRSNVSVANLTRVDGYAFFPPARRAAGVRTDPLEAANRAPDAPRHGRLEGVAGLVPR